MLSVSCESFVEGWDESPNSPTSTTPALLLTNIEVSTIATYTGQLARTAAILTQQCTGVTDQMYNVIQNYNITESDAENEWQSIYETGLHTSHTLINDYAEDYPYYIGIAKIFKALNLGIATDYFGDIPNREALKGLEGEENFHPHFDPQETVIQDIQTLLDEAISDLSKPTSANKVTPGMDDIIFGGNVDSWIRTAWIIKARYAIRLTKRNETTAIDNAISFLNSAYAAGLASSDDDANAYFDGSGTSQNQWWDFENERGGYMRMGEFFVDILKNSNDPRLSFYVGTNPDGEYVGAPMGATDPSTYSYLGSYVAEVSNDVPMVTYREAKFIEAEANFRKNNKTAAAAAYNEAVIASVEKVTGATIPDAYKPLKPVKLMRLLHLRKS